jgi:nitroreductase
VSLERAILSPNSSNMQLWEFHWLKTKKEIDEMAPLCLGQRAASTAQQMVVFVTRRDKWKSRAQWNANQLKASFQGEPT